MTAQTGDSNLAARRLQQLIAAQEDPRPLADAWREDAGFAKRLCALLGGSETLGAHLVDHADAWRRIAAGGQDDVVAVQNLPSTVSGADDAVETLKVAYRTELAAIAAWDLAHGMASAAGEPSSSPESTVGDPDAVMAVGRALSQLADHVLAAAMSLAEQRHPATVPVRLAVIAMGKCGAGELNYLSDVDVVFVVADGAEQAELRIATARAAEMMRICAEVAWEVDAALRPEGTAGPLVRTLGGYRAYYEKWAKTWEFQALLKARPAAGDPALGRAFAEMADGFVWAAAGRPGFVADVQAMRRRVEASVPPAARDDELKLSAGGLRDVEFAVQLLQLVHGRSDASIREPGTLAALAALTASGYVGRTDGRELAAAYAFERAVEHRAQLQRLRRTHSLPARHPDRTWLARTVGVSGADGLDATGQLAAALSRHGATVRRLHEKLFYRPLLTAVAAVPTDELRLTSDAAVSRLSALGFEAAGPALGHIRALTDGVSRRAAIQRTLLPVLLGRFADAPDPDGGLLGYRSVSDALEDTPWYLRLLRDEGVVADRLAGLLGTSRLVADLLQRAPEVLRLLGSDAALVGDDPAAARVQAAQALRARTSRARDGVTAAAAARSARRHEMLRLACADLLGLADVHAVMAGLTSIADATVLAAVDAAQRMVMAERLGKLDVDGASTGLAASLVVIAMGRFGGEEMGYSSDADALFVAVPTRPDADPKEVATDAAAIAEATSRLLARPSPDPPLVIDADLRPEGRSGPLVRTVDSYRQFWDRSIAPWQRQALLRARPLGTSAAALAFRAVIDPLRYPADGLSPADVREIRRIKARMDSERLPRGADRALHTKLGSGGLADVEWAVQLLQLRHGGQVPELRTTSTLAAIVAATQRQLIDAASAAALTEGWVAATRARNAIMLVTGHSGDQIPPHGRPLAAVARACGYPADADPGAFIDDYRRATRHARRVVDHLFDQD